MVYNNGHLKIISQFRPTLSFLKKCSHQAKNTWKTFLSPEISATPYLFENFSHLDVIQHARFNPNSIQGLPVIANFSELALSRIRGILVSSKDPPFPSFTRLQAEAKKYSSMQRRDITASWRSIKAALRLIVIAFVELRSTLIAASSNRCSESRAKDLLFFFSSRGKVLDSIREGGLERLPETLGTFQSLGLPLFHRDVAFYIEFFYSQFDEAVGARVFLHLFSLAFLLESRCVE